MSLPQNKKRKKTHSEDDQPNTSHTHALPIIAPFRLKRRAIRDDKNTISLEMTQIISAQRSSLMTNTCPLTTIHHRNSNHQTLLETSYLHILLGCMAPPNMTITQHPSITRGCNSSLHATSYHRLCCATWTLDRKLRKANDKLLANIQVQPQPQPQLTPASVLLENDHVDNFDTGYVSMDTVLKLPRLKIKKHSQAVSGVRIFKRILHEQLAITKMLPAPPSLQNDTAEPMTLETIQALYKPPNLPSSWCLGDPYPQDDLTADPNWAEATEGMSESSKLEALAFLDRAGDNARNQLARPTEYLAQAMHVQQRLQQFFFEQGLPGCPTSGKRIRNPVTLSDHTTSNQLDWFHHVYPELELYYDENPTNCTFVSVFYFSLIGKNLPKTDVWTVAAKVELLNVQFQEIKATKIYVPNDDPNNKHYKPSQQIDDLTILKEYCSHKEHVKETDKIWLTKNPNAAVTTDDMEVEETEENEDPMLLSESLVNTSFWESYFCNIFSNPDHPTLHPNQKFMVGNAEMVNKELGNTLPPSSKTSCDPEYCGKLNEDDLDWLRKQPKFSTLSKLSSMRTNDVVYVNGRSLRTNAAKLLERTFYKPTAPGATNRRTPTGYNVLVENIKTYRVVIKTGVSAYHFRDHISAPKTRPHQDLFNTYCSQLKVYLNQRSAMVGLKDSDLSGANMDSEDLLTEEDREYMRLVGIQIPSAVAETIAESKLRQLLIQERKNLSQTIRDPQVAGFKQGTNKSRKRCLEPKNTVQSGKGALTSYFKVVESGKKTVASTATSTSTVTKKRQSPKKKTSSDKK